MKKSIYLTLLILLMSSNFSFAQNNKGILKGRVIDKVTQSPLPDAVIEVINTGEKTGTDSEGYFTFDDLEITNIELKVSYIGYTDLLKTDLVLYPNRPLEIIIEMNTTSITTNEIEVESNYFQKDQDINVSSINLDYEEIRRAPGAAEDISRMIQSGPGVSISNDQRNDLIIRGGSASENLFLIDGVEILNLNHFGSQGSTGGPIGLINLKFLQDANIYTGGFPVMYGNKLSGAVDLKFRNGSRKYYYNNLDLSLQGFGGLFEGALSKNSSYLVSVRRSYLDLIQNAIRLSAVPKYWDLNMKLSFDLNEKNSLGFVGFSAIDNIEFGKRDTTDENANPFQNVTSDRQFYGGGFTHKYFIKNGYIQNVLSTNITDFNTVQNNKDNTSVIYSNKSLESETLLKSDLYLQLNNKLNLTSGIGGKMVLNNYNIYNKSDTSYTGYITPELRFDNDISSAILYGYSNLSSRLFNERLTVNAGLRYDYFGYLNNKGNFSPRIGASYNITPVTTINASAGIFYQNPEYIWLASDESNKNLEMIKAEHYIFGIEHYFAPDIRATAEVYRKNYSNYPVSVNNPTYILVNGGSEYGPNLVGSAVSDGYGTVDGFDISIQKKLSGNGIYGMLNYSYMNSQFQALAGGKVPGAFDQTNQITLTLGYQVAKDWLIGLKYKYATGKPYTPFDTEASIAADRGIYDMSRYNALRIPDYQRIDLRIDKNFTFNNIGIVGYIEFQNLLNKENISEYYWDEDRDTTGKILNWGFFPVGGFSLQF